MDDVFDTKDDSEHCVPHKSNSPPPQSSSPASGWDSKDPTVYQSGSTSASSPMDGIATITQTRRGPHPYSKEFARTLDELLRSVIQRRSQKSLDSRSQEDSRTSCPSSACLSRASGIASSGAADNGFSSLDTGAVNQNVDSQQPGRDFELHDDTRPPSNYTAFQAIPDTHQHLFPQRTLCSGLDSESSFTAAGCNADTDSGSLDTPTFALPASAPSTATSTPSFHRQPAESGLPGFKKRLETVWEQQKVNRNLQFTSTNEAGGRTVSSSSPTGEPVMKKPKVGSSSRAASAHSIPNNRVGFARRSASLRRAESLQVDIGRKSGIASGSQRGDWAHISSSTPNPHLSWIPTAPASPEPTQIRSRNAAHSGKPVPIIAPPPNLVPQLPLNEDGRARVRVQRIVEREDKLRGEESLINAYLMTGDNAAKFEWEKRLELGQSLRREAIEWILEILPAYTVTERQNDGSQLTPTSTVSNNSPTSTATLSSCSVSSTRSSSPTTILSEVSSSSASGSFISTVSHSPQFSLPKVSNLHDQLSTSPDTRFHAAHIFLRYFYIMGGSGECSGHSHVTDASPGQNGDLNFGESSDGEVNGEDISARSRFELLSASTARAPAAPCDSFLRLGVDFQEGREMVMWDTAVACLALSIKYDRDFLHPLLPIFATEFQRLAPHVMHYEDLETAQREVLGALSYTLGVTPQAVLDEVWRGFPELRELFDYDGGWNSVLRETWGLLLVSILEPDVLQFPIWLLTAAALAEGITTALFEKYKYQVPWYEHQGLQEQRRSLVAGVRVVKREDILERIKQETEGVFLDLMAVLGARESSFEACRKWLGHQG